jgi:hypothetical protein
MYVIEKDGTFGTLKFPHHTSWANFRNPRFVWFHLYGAQFVQIPYEIVPEGLLGEKKVCVN